MSKRMHGVMNKFSLEQKESKRNQLLQRIKGKPVEAYGNGTMGYKITNGTNAGKILAHVRTPKKNTLDQHISIYMKEHWKQWWLTYVIMTTLTVGYLWGVGIIQIMYNWIIFWIIVIFISAWLGLNVW